MLESILTHNVQRFGSGLCKSISCQHLKVASLQSLKRLMWWRHSVHVSMDKGGTAFFVNLWEGFPSQRWSWLCARGVTRGTEWQAGRGGERAVQRERHTGRGTRGKSEWGDMTYEQPVRTLTRERDLTSDSLLFPQRLCKSSDKLACIALRGFLKRSDILHYVHISPRQNCTNQPVTLTDFSCVLALLHKHIL